MNEKPVKPIPAARSWIQNVNERAILYVSEVDEVKERIRIKRFARYAKEGPEFDGRTTWLSYETYRKGSRYMPREAPLNPDCLPEKITREQAQEALELEGWTKEQASFSVDNATWQVDDLIGRPSAILRAYLGKPAPAVTPPDGMPVTETETLTADEAKERLRVVAGFRERERERERERGRKQATTRLRLVGYSAEDAGALVDFPEATRKWLAHNPDVPAAPILRAYVRGLDAKIAALSGAKIVNLFEGPEHNDVPAAQPTIADVIAAIEALRAEVRADHKPLLDAVDQVLGNHGPYGSESDVVEVHLDAFKALRAARAKVA